MKPYHYSIFFKALSNGCFCAPYFLRLAPVPSSLFFRTFSSFLLPYFFAFFSSLVASKSQAEELRAEYEDKLTDARQEAAKLVADAQNRAQRAYECRHA